MVVQKNLLKTAAGSKSSDAGGKMRRLFQLASRRAASLVGEVSKGSSKEVRNSIKVAVKEQEIAVKEQEVAVNEQEVAVKEQEVAVKEQEVAVKEQEVAVKEQEVAVKEQYCGGSNKASSAAPSIHLRPAPISCLSHTPQPFSLPSLTLTFFLYCPLYALTSHLFISTFFYVVF
ncbi:hypothetical protein FHG87_022240 [Trinorchestia longiramus]|nr:hypothetical protein FHG87_022240 [Trinorchestia longiramus]